MALLTKLSGSSQFCSDDLRKRYQDESNRLALDRLMQGKKSKKRPGAKPVQAVPVEADAPPPEISFLIEDPDQQQPVRNRPAGNTTPIWRVNTALYPRVPPMEPESIFSTIPLQTLPQDFQDLGMAAGGRGSQSGSTGVAMVTPQILMAEGPLP